MVDEPNKSERAKDELFGKSQFDVEHALVMYATSYCTIPAAGIYDREILKPFMSVIETCHIYLIGYAPKVEWIDAKQKDRKLELTYSVLGNSQIASFDLSDGLVLKRDGELCYLEDPSGQRYWPSLPEQYARLGVRFEVKYVGQAYGQDGSRNAIDRLLKHETLQKNSAQGDP
jgi:hypothetical protein